MNPFNRTSIHISGQKRSALDMARSRVTLFSLVCILVSLSVGARVVAVPIIDGAVSNDEDAVSCVGAVAGAS